MALGVCLLFDPASDRALRGLWNRLEERGVSTLRSHTHGRHVPHLSYAVMLHWGLDAVRAAVAALPDGGEVTMVLDAVGAFRRGRVGLIPAVPEDLVRRQQTVVEAVQATGAEVHRHYRAGRWLPHCSVAPRTRLDQLPVAAASLYEVIPLTVRLDHAALIDSSTGARWPLPHLP